MNNCLPYDATLNTRALSRIFDNMTASYKCFWFLSILDAVVSEDRFRFSYDELVAGMVSKAWYPHHIFRLSFGSPYTTDGKQNDNLPRYCDDLQREFGIPSDAEQNTLLNSLSEVSTGRTWRSTVDGLTKYVPLALLSPWRNEEGTPLYRIESKHIILDEAWSEYLKRCYPILVDFTLWHLVEFFQKRNPNVPNIQAKLMRPEADRRKSLKRQRDYWEFYIRAAGGMNCIYTDNPIVGREFDLDHFIPWSFVTHDQLWNLIPADASINSSKSNHIPSIEKYIRPLALLHQRALTVARENDYKDRIIEDYLVFHCSLDELISASPEKVAELFRKEMSPISQIALNMGFSQWSR